jgi:transcriptional regulator with XRE-family HTH domain
VAQRTFKPDAAKIERLRIQRGWSLPDLVRESGVANRTVDAVMLGKSVVISTISRIAKALEVLPEAIIVGFELPQGTAHEPESLIPLDSLFRARVIDDVEDVVKLICSLSEAGIIQAIELKSADDFKFLMSRFHHTTCLTLSYIAAMKASAFVRDFRKESDISMSWRTLARTIHRYELPGAAQLAERVYYKARYWADYSSWSPEDLTQPQLDIRLKPLVKDIESFMSHLRIDAPS